MTTPDDNAVLSQAAIDEMLARTSGTAGPAPATPPPAKEAPPPTPAPTAQQASSPPPRAADTSPTAATAPSPATGTGSTALSDVLNRLERLEAELSRISAAERANGEMQSNVQALVSEMQAVSGRLNDIVQHLSNTLGYRVRETFTCGACGTQGFVAVPVTCTHCKQQTWVGWSPQA